MVAPQPVVLDATAQRSRITWQSQYTPCNSHGPTSDWRQQSSGAQKGTTNHRHLEPKRRWFLGPLPSLLKLVSWALGQGRQQRGADAVRATCSCDATLVVACPRRRTRFDKGGGGASSRTSCETTYFAIGAHQHVHYTTSLRRKWLAHEHDERAQPRGRGGEGGRGGTLQVGGARGTS